MNIALLGFGTVGRGFYELLTERPLSLNICAVLARRPLEGLNCMVTSDFYKILNEADADIIVEAMGGLEPAHEYICAALRAKNRAFIRPSFLRTGVLSTHSSVTGTQHEILITAKAETPRILPLKWRKVCSISLPGRLSDWSIAGCPTLISLWSS